MRQRAVRAWVRHGWKKGLREAARVRKRKEREERVVAFEEGRGAMRKTLWAREALLGAERMKTGGVRVKIRWVGEHGDGKETWEPLLGQPADVRQFANREVAVHKLARRTAKAAVTAVLQSVGAHAKKRAACGEVVAGEPRRSSRLASESTGGASCRAGAEGAMATAGDGDTR